MRAQTALLGLAGAATTMLVRKTAKRAMYTRTGAPRLPQPVRSNNSFAMVLLLAAAAGAMLAIADVLQEQRKQVARE